MKINRVIWAIAIISLVFALCLSWMVPADDFLQFAKQLLPEAQSFERLTSSPLTFEGTVQNEDGQAEKIGYVVIDEADAYGGPIKIATCINCQGEIIGTIIIDHKDTPSFINRIKNERFLEQFIEKNIADPLSLDQDIDAVTGATYSSKGIAKAISQGSHAVAREQFNLDIQEEVEPFVFGSKEITVLSLVILMLIGVIFKFRKLRWVTLAGGLIFIGFQYNTPISLANVATLLMGNFPSIRENLVWYILLIGIPVMTFILGRNLYCFWLCPFGALQELLAKIGGGNFKCCNKAIEAKASKIKYLLAYVALLGAILLKSPGFAGYEPFATLFGMQGIGLQWFILPAVLFTALFITRFWCRFFCPVMVVNEVILKLRRLTKRIKEKVTNPQSHK
jgi:NosR/NirI family nitrous oxide reductase transcriptional regulator